MYSIMQHILLRNGYIRSFLSWPSPPHQLPLRGGAYDNPDIIRSIFVSRGKLRRPHIIRFVTVQNIRQIPAMASRR